MFRKLAFALQERIPYWLPAPLVFGIVLLALSFVVDRIFSIYFSHIVILILFGFWLYSFLKSPGSSYLRLEKADSVEYIVIPAPLPAGPIIVCALSATILVMIYAPLAIFPALWAAYLVFNALGRRRTLVVLGGQHMKIGMRRYRYDEVVEFSVIGKSGGSPAYMQQSSNWLAGIFDLASIINVANSNAMQERSNYLCIRQRQDGKNQKVAFGISMPNGEYLISEIMKDIDAFRAQELPPS